MSDDLLSRLAAAVDDAERESYQVLDLGNWVSVQQQNWAVERLRHVEHARRVMQRHARTWINAGVRCCEHDCAEWPCPDLLDLAAAWGVTE